MAFSYAGDTYVNKDPAVQGLGKETAARAIQASVLDVLAAEAIESKAKNPGKEMKAEMTLAKDSITCSLQPETGYKLQGEAVRCPQPRSCRILPSSDPREEEPGKMFVQVGKNLYSAFCQLPGSRVNLSSGGNLDFAKFLTSVADKIDAQPNGKGIESFIKQNIGILTTMGSDAKDKVAEARKQCDELIESTSKKAQNAASVPEPRQKSESRKPTHAAPGDK